MGRANQIYKEDNKNLKNPTQINYWNRYIYVAFSAWIVLFTQHLGNAFMWCCKGRAYIIYDTENMYSVIYVVSFWLLYRACNV